LPLLKALEGTILASQRLGIRGISVDWRLPRAERGQTYRGRAMIRQSVDGVAPHPAVALIPDASRPAVVPVRIASVDALRGFDMICIISAAAIALSLSDMLAGKGPVLNAISEIAARQFEHAPWEGLRFYDLLFPLFIFLVGVVIPFSLTPLVEREGRLRAHWRVLMRSFWLLLLGFLYYGGFSHHWPDIRLLGVLQRIGLCYLFTSLLFLHLRLRGLIVSFLLLVVGYWALMTFVPVPGVGAGSFTEAGNLAAWIDEHFLPGEKLLGTLDPEGLLSTLPAIGTALLGVFAGLLLKNPGMTPRQRVLWLTLAGIALVTAGYAWSFQFPVIKSIWTSSYVLVTGGLSALLLALFYQIIDVWGYRRWAAAFVWVGANAILLYLIEELVRFHRLASRLVGGDIGDFANTHLAHGAGQFLANVLGMTLAIAVAGFLYRRRLFIRV
jgi:predicted acyltransferase